MPQSTDQPVSPKHSLPAGVTLLIPDVHQDIAWVRAILDREAGYWDQLVFLGDYFDSYNRPPVVATAGQTAEFLLEVERAHPGRVTFLLGNHDIPYMEVLEVAGSGGGVVLPENTCSGFKFSAARKIAQALDAGFRSRCRLFVACNGFLISHAGVHPTFWRAGQPGVTDPLEALDALCATAMEYLNRCRVSILGCGSARGGIDEVGGVTWLDWDEEFEDDPALPPQIVGHTPSSRGPRWQGRSCCIDGGQTCYALLFPSGDLQVRRLD